jgi:hypothetical protein
VNGRIGEGAGRRLHANLEPILRQHVADDGGTLLGLVT